MSFIRFTSVSLLLFISALPLAAQVNSAVGQVQLQDQRQQLQDTLKNAQKRAVAESNEIDIAPELFTGELEDVGPQQILRQKRKKRWLDLRLDSQFFYTSNSDLTENGTGSTMLVSSLALAVGPEVVDVRGGELRPRLGYRHQWFNYSIFGNEPGPGVVDFDVQTLYGYLQYNTHKDWEFLAGLEYTRLVNHQPDYFSYNEFYNEFRPRVSATRYHFISETRFIGLNYQAAYHESESPLNFANPDDQDRFEQAMVLGYTHGFSPQLVVQPFYRLLHAHYTSNGDRDDFVHTLGVFAFYKLSDHFNLRSFFTYDLRESDLPLVPDYRKYDIGVALNFSKKF